MPQVKQTTEKMIAQTTIIEMGWTKALIAKFLPEPTLKPNPHYKKAAPMKLWKESDVLAVMQMDDFLDALEKTNERRKTAQKAISTKKENLNKRAFELAKSLHISIIPDNELRKKTLEAKQSWYDYLAELSKEADFLIDLMSGKDLYTDNGQLSETGLATVGLRGMNYNTYMNQADQYAEEVKKLNAEIAKDPNNTKLIERREELLGLQRDSINAAKQEKQAIVDMVENGIDVQLDSMQELIDKYNDALDSAKNFNDYQKKVRDKTSEIGNLNKQLAAYTNDDSEETRAAVQKLQVEMQKAQEELDETEYDQFITDQKKLLDDLYSEYETSMNQRLDNIDVLIEDMIGSINTNSGAINDTLHEIAEKNGYTLSDDMNSIWSSSAFTLNNTVSVYGDDFKEKLTGISYVLDRIQDNTSAMAANSNSSKYLHNDIPAFASGGLAKHTGLAHLDGTPSKPELVLNPKDTENFLAIIEEIKKRQGSDILVGSTLPHSMKEIPQIVHSVGSVDIERKLAQIISQTGTNGGDTTTTFGDINIHIDHVQDYDDFVRQLQHDDEFEKMIQAMTVGRAMGKDKLEKYRYYVGR